MPYKDPERKKQYNHEFYERIRERRLQQMKVYRESHQEEIAEARARRLHVCGMYLGSIPTPPKSRQKSNEGLNNGKTE